MRRQKPTVIKINNKGSQQARLPSRTALHQLTGGNAVQQSMGNYAKLTPSDPSVNYSDIMKEGDLPIPPAFDE